MIEDTSDMASMSMLAIPPPLASTVIVGVPVSRASSAKTGAMCVVNAPLTHYSPSVVESDKLPPPADVAPLSRSELPRTPLSALLPLSPGIPLPTRSPGGVPVPLTLHSASL
jgi:hypothetical protein